MTGSDRTCEVLTVGQTNKTFEAELQRLLSTVKLITNYFDKVLVILLIFGVRA